MQIENILYQLLLDHECIILPTFGGFIVRESPCNFNAGRDILKPYSKSVFFNQHLQENDGLLINAIVKDRNISYSEGNILLEEWIISINKQIESDGNALIGKIGRFYKGNDGNKWFTPDSALNLSLHTYGLRPIKAVTVANKVILPEEQVLELKTLTDNKPIETFKVQKTNWKAWAAAAAIALLVHVSYLTIENYTHPASTHEASIITAIIDSPEIKSDDIIVTDTVAKEEIVAPESFELPTEDLLKENKVIKDETTIPEKIPVEEQSPPSKETVIKMETGNEYIEGKPVIETIRVIKAKYLLEINAINHHKDLLKEGLSTSIEKDENGFYEVVLLIFKTPKN